MPKQNVMPPKFAKRFVVTLQIYLLKYEPVHAISNMQTKYLCVLIHIWIKGEVGAVKPV